MYYSALVLMRLHHNKPSLYFLAASALLYAGSLINNSFCVAGKCNGWPGYGVLIFGAIPLVSSPANLTWLANPLLFLSWKYTFRLKTKQSIACASVALLLAASFLLFRNVVTNEGGTAAPITGYALGYWLWLASMSCSLLAALSLRKRPANVNR